MATITTTRTNLATNPSFETASGTATSRTNLCTNPAAATVSGWGYVVATGLTGQSSTAIASGGPASGPGTFVRLSFTGGPGTGTVGFYRSGASATAAATYTFSRWVRYSVAVTVTAGMEWYNSSSAKISTSYGTATSVPANTWTQVSVTAVAPAGTVTVNTTSYAASATYAATDTADATGELLEQSMVVGTYFDGGTAAAGDFTYSWNGSANNSTSGQRGLGLTQQGSYTGAGAGSQSTVWSNSQGHALRITPTSTTTNDCWYAVNGDTGAMRLGFVAGNTYTVSATCHIEAAQTGSLSAYARSLRVFYKVNGSYTSVGSPQIANVASTTGRVSVTVTIPATATEAFLRLYDGAYAGNGDVWWDDLLIEQVSTLGSYFDGNSSSWQDTTYAPAATRSYSWTGTAGNSTSTESLSVPLQNYQIQLPDNTITGAGTSVGYLEASGLRGTPSSAARSGDTDRAGVDGTAPGMSFLTARTVGVKWLIANPAIGQEAALQLLTGNWQNITDPSTVVMTARDYLLQLAQGGAKPVSALQFQLPGRPVPILALGKPGKLEAPVNSAYQFGWLEVPSEWVVPDGKLYDATVNTATATLPTSAGTGAPFAWSFPVNFGPSTGGTLQVTNGGDYPAKPVYKIAGPVANPRITNPATGQYIRVNLSLGTGDVLVIDTDSRVVRLNGVNRNNALDTGSSFFAIPPGGASLSFASTDGGAVAGTVTVYTLNTYSAT